MGWRDRDYAKWTDGERRRFYGSVGARTHTTGSRGGVAPGALLAVVVSFLAALALGQLPRSHPLIPALHFNLPVFSRTPVSASTGAISLPRRSPLGSFLTLHGQLPPGESGTVTVEGAYIRPPWKLLASVPASNGSYTARIPLDHRGLLHLRVTYPDGHRSVGETRVG
jgi:hypothetical protein